MQSDIVENPNNLESVKNSIWPAPASLINPNLDQQKSLKDFQNMQNGCPAQSNFEQQKSVKDFKLVPSGIIETAGELKISYYVGLFYWGIGLKCLGLLTEGRGMISIDTGRYLNPINSLPVMRVEVRL